MYRTKRLKKSLRRSQKILTSSFSDPIRMGGDCLAVRPIDQFAREYLGLNVSFAYLSEDGSICGLTAYTDTEYIMEDRGFQRKIPAAPKRSPDGQELYRAFTDSQALWETAVYTRPMSECAHQILFQMETDKIREACRAEILRPGQPIRSGS